MPFLGATTTKTGLRPNDRPAGLAGALGADLPSIAPGAPVTILIHGYRFDPGHPDFDPHRLLFAPEPTRTCARIQSWTRGLGVNSDPATGQSVGLGLRAGGARREPCRHWTHRVRAGP